jgi:hypothetical protein
VKNIRAEEWQIIGGEKYMKAHIPASMRLTKREKAIVKEYDDSIQNENFMRYVKLSIVALHEQFGFGHDRAADFLGTISRLAEEAEKDEIFWEHIDKIVIEELKLELQRENYKAVDR